MKLKAIISQIKTSFKLVGKPDSIDQIIIDDIAIDSRLVKKNSIFFALPGKSKDGAEFIKDAVKNGAAVVVAAKCDQELEIPFIQSDDAFSLLVEVLKIFYAPLPANIYAVTGTNGKTSVAEFIRQILQFLGKDAASIGTLGVITETQNPLSLQNSTLTTADIVCLYKNLHSLKKAQVDDVAIEVSSIGLEQQRIAGLNISVGAFTNFTQDHLDYHQSMEEYFRCKMLLFDRVLENGATAVLNADIAEYEKIKEICEKKNQRIFSYGHKSNYFKLLDVKINGENQEFSFEFCKKIYSGKLKITGEFQVFNILCALASVMALHSLSQTDLEKLLQHFSEIKPAAGRMQKVATLANDAQVFIDFAHSPDALENVLHLARKLTKERVVLLFGCGGNRDAKKRPIMGKIACELADLVIVTDDNPRLEDAATIRKQILFACATSKIIEIADRKVAIAKAISMLEPQDILILAGKGHEKYQIIGDQKFDFDEEKIVKNAIK